MAVDTFLKLGDIKGESKDSKHGGEIDVLSWSWGVSQTGTMSYGGGGGAGKANFQDLNFMHNVDKASPILMLKCATGEHIKEATLVSRKAGKTQQEYLDRQAERDSRHERAAVGQQRASDGKRLDEFLEDSAGLQTPRRKTDRSTGR